MALKLSLHTEEWNLIRPFRISGHVWRTAPCVVVEIGDGQFVGRGEAQGVYYHDETPASMSQQISEVEDEIARGADRLALLELLPPGGARNALDCAMWDLEARQQGKTIWQLTGIQPNPVTTVFTIGLEDTPEQMAALAAKADQHSILKIKLNADQPLARLQAIRAARPDVQLVVDVNEGWTFDELTQILPQCEALDLGMIEQPLPRESDHLLEGLDSPVVLAADESCQDSSDLKSAARRYGMVNIKLDKTGGLTEALVMARQARELGCKLMVGNMTGTSLAMAPAFVLAQLCDFVDIDGPLLLKHDYLDGLIFDQDQVKSCKSGFWGSR